MTKIDPIKWIFLILLLAFFQKETRAQTWKIQTSPINVNLSAVTFTDSQTGWAVGNNGTIIHTANGGQTWTAQTSTTTQLLRGVTFWDSQTGWAVGNNGTILHTTNGGQTWTAQTSTTTEVLSDVTFTDSQIGWAVGFDGTILHTMNGGQTWTAQTSNTTEILRKVTFTDSQKGWVVGFSGTIIHTANGGQTWTAQTSTTTDALFGMTFTDSQTGWAVGFNATILHTINGGQTWTAQTSNTTKNLAGVTFTDSQTGWIVGSDGTILHTINGGQTWTAQTSNTTEFLGGVTFTDSQTGWAVGGARILTFCPPSCGITAISTADISACSFDGTNSTFTADVTVTFTNRPNSGMLDLTGDGTESVAVGSLDGPTSHKFTGVSMTADGGDINLTATFSADSDCKFTEAKAGTAPATCPPCGITAISATNASDCSYDGTNSTFTADVTVTFTNRPNSGMLNLTGDGNKSVAVGSLDGPTSHKFTGVSMTADGGAINLIATFSADTDCKFTEAMAGTAPAACPTSCGITAISTADISSCSYDGTTSTFTANVTVTFSDPPSTGTLDLSGDGMDMVNVSDLSGTTHIFQDVSMTADGGDISLTATFSAETDCTFTEAMAGTAPAVCPTSCGITAISTADISSCSYDGTTSTFTADVTVTFSDPPSTGTLDLSGDGMDMVNVSDLNGTTHIFQDVSMTADGGDINLTATFSADTDCKFTVANAGTAPAACPPSCGITAISTAEISSCSYDGTTSTFTADVTVTFTNQPGSGMLDLTGDGTKSVAVGSLDGPTSHKFTGVSMTADGGDINLIATFSADTDCKFTEANAGTAPAACEPANCSISNIQVSNCSGPSNGTETVVIRDAADPSCMASVSVPICTDGSSLSFTFTNVGASGNFELLVDGNVVASGDATAFGDVVTPGAAAAAATIPTMSEWGLMIFGLLIMNLSVFFVQRRELI